MKFEIDFNDQSKHDDNFLIDVLGAKLESTGSNKYPPFERLVIEVIDFKHLEQLLNIVDNHYGDYYSAIISFDRPTIYLDNKI